MIFTIQTDKNEPQRKAIRITVRTVGGASGAAYTKYTKTKTITNRENSMIVLLVHFQIIVDVIEYYTSARTFVI